MSPVWAFIAPSILMGVGLLTIVVRARVVARRRDHEISVLESAYDMQRDVDALHELADALDDLNRELAHRAFVDSLSLAERAQIDTLAFIRASVGAP